MSVLAPVGFTEQFPFADRLMDWLRWGATLRRLTFEEVAEVELAMDEERRYVREQARRLLSDIELYANRVESKLQQRAGASRGSALSLGGKVDLEYVLGSGRHDG